MQSGLTIDDNLTKRWYLDGLLHRENGPAVKWINGDKFWYIKGIQLSEQERKSRIRSIKIKKLLG
jgi:hypothetical protein